MGRQRGALRGLTRRAEPAGACLLGPAPGGALPLPHAPTLERTGRRRCLPGLLRSCSFSHGCRQDAPAPLARLLTDNAHCLLLSGLVFAAAPLSGPGPFGLPQSRGVVPSRGDQCLLHHDAIRESTTANGCLRFFFVAPNQRVVGGPCQPASREGPKQDSTALASVRRDHKPPAAMAMGPLRAGAEWAPPVRWGQATAARFIHHLSGLLSCLSPACEGKLRRVRI